MEICRVKLQEAIDSDNRDVMIDALRYAKTMLPFSVDYEGVTETRVIFYSNDRRPLDVPIDSLDLQCARWNVQGYINAIDKEFVRE